MPYYITFELILSPFAHTVGASVSGCSEHNSGSHELGTQPEGNERLHQ